MRRQQRSDLGLEELELLGRELRSMLRSGRTLRNEEDTQNDWQIAKQADRSDV